MKKIKNCILVFFVFISISAFAQEPIWLDANWNVTSKDNATYYRPNPVKTDKGYKILDYYAGGTLQMVGFSSTRELAKEKFNGLVSYFFENGKVFQEVNYNNGELNGVRKIYFENGTLKSERFYSSGKMNGKYSEYYDSGELFEVGNYEGGHKKGVWKTYYKNGKIKTRGKYRNQEKVGVWKTFYKNENK